MALVGRGLGGWPLVIGNIGWRPALCRAMEGAAALGLLLAVTVLGERLFKKRLLGGGDIRLVGLIGLWLGWRGCWLSVWAAAMLALAECCFRKCRAVRWGPALAAGTLFYIVFFSNR